MHPTALDFVARAIARSGPRRRVVELGARDVNGSVRLLFPDAAYIGVDICAGPGVDVVADAAGYAPDRAVDTVVCTSMLEHTPRAGEIVTNAYRMLEPDGVLILTTVTDPFPPHSAIDGSLTLAPGEYYRNVVREELVGWLAPFAEVWLEHSRLNGDIFVWARKA